MANVGKASLLIVPKFDGLSASVVKHLKGIDTSSAGVEGGERYSDGFGKGASGLLRSGGLVGIFSEVTRRAMDVIGSSVDAAASRLDTLNNYPRVLESLGASSDEAEASISLMSERLQGLPTALNDMASTAQGIYAITKDLDQSTRAGLALNDMLLAGGQSQQVVNAATEQFRQMLARGKPELEDWKSLLLAAPGQMDQLAKSMLGPAASANSLYAALGGGKSEAIISMDQLLDKVIELDEQGGEGFKSFEQQARAATGGIATGAANMQTAVSRGVADVMDAVGSENISEAMSGVGDAFEDGLGVVADVAGAATPVVKSMVGGLLEVAPAAIGATAVLAAVAHAGPAIEGLSSSARSLGDSFLAPSKTCSVLGDGLLSMAARAKEGSRAQSGLLSIATKLGSVSAGPLALGIGAAAYTTIRFAQGAMEAEKRERALEGASRSLSKVISDARSWNEYADGIGSAGQSASGAAMSLEELAASIGKHAEAMAQSKAEAEQSIQSLAAAQATIEKYAGATNLSAQAQGELEYALGIVNEQFGLSISAADVAAGKYTDADGNVRDLTSSIKELVEAKKQEIKVDLYKQNLAEAYAGQAEALEKVSSARDAVTAAEERYRQNADPNLDQLYWEQLQMSNRELERAQGLYDDTTSAVRNYEEQMAATMAQSNEAVAAMTETIRLFGDDAYWAIRAAGGSLESLAMRLADAGISTETLSAIGAENFTALAESCNGNMDAMVAAIAGYNMVPILDKSGHVQVSYATLQDAQGNILVWNNDHLEDLNGNAIVDDRELVDAQGNLYTWNGSTLEHLEGSAEVDGNLKEAASLKAQWNDGDLLDKYATAYITIQQSGNAAGGIRMNAAGGVRYHADGAFIATRAMPLDIVGEDGAEAIVPLTNKRYSQPFVDLLADGVAERESSQLDRLVSIGRNIVHLLEAINENLPEGIDIMDLKRMGVGS